MDAELYSRRWRKKESDLQEEGGETKGRGARRCAMRNREGAKNYPNTNTLSSRQMEALEREREG